MNFYNNNSKESIANEIKKLQQEIENLQNRQRELEEIPDLICVFPETESDMGIMKSIRSDKFNPHAPTYIKFEKYEEVLDHLKDIVNQYQMYEEVNDQYYLEKNPNYRYADVENVEDSLRTVINEATYFVMNQLKNYR